MRIATVIMRFLTPRRQIQLRDLDRNAPGHVVQDVLHHLPAGPLVPAGDGEVHDDDTQGFTRDAVTGDLVVALAGPCLGPSHQTRDDGRVSLDRVLERAGRSGHELGAGLRGWLGQRVPGAFVGRLLPLLVDAGQCRGVGVVGRDPLVDRRGREDRLD